MPQQTSGLRFDIYERVYLPENAIPIRELNGMELTPEISVIQQGEQAVLNGNLVLTGTYTGEDEGNTEARITHYIPVEITLPLNRIKNLEDIQMEIENFDVDVLTPKSLNVTGVLSLQGVETVHEAEPVRMKEEMWFSHRVEEAPPTPAAEPEQAAPQAVPANEEPPAEAMEADMKAQEEPIANEPPAEAEINAASESEGQLMEEAAEADEPKAEDMPPEPEKQEIKIAFSGKSADEEQETIGVQSIMQMAQSGMPVKEPPPAPSEDIEAAEAKEAAESARDALEWKKRFLGSSHDSFRTVRMVIVQKEDTIESIAERYKKNAREIMLYNQISDEYLQEGQIVYIP